MSISKTIQEKAKKVMEIVNSLDSDMKLEPSAISFSLSAYPCKIRDDGSFFVMTGTRQKPSGIAHHDSDFLFIYREEVGEGMFVPSYLIIDIIKKEKDSLKIGIDDEYKKMGVYLNLGILSAYLSEDFLSALPQIS